MIVFTIIINLFVYFAEFFSGIQKSLYNLCCKREDKRKWHEYAENEIDDAVKQMRLRDLKWRMSK